MHWADWWTCELELTPHLEKRIEDRDFTEVDLRDMLHRATGLRPAAAEGRFVVESTLRHRRWQIIVEPTKSTIF